MAFSGGTGFGGGSGPKLGHEWQSQRQSRARGGSRHEWQSQKQRLVPGSGPKAPKPVTPGAPPSPLDSTYYENLNNEQFRVGNQINGLNEQQGFRQEDLQNALGQLARQQPLDQLKTQESANKQGLFYSGHLGEALGQLNQNYLAKQSGLQDNFQRSAADEASRISALQGGLRLFQEQQYQAAALRASERDRKDPSLGLPNGPKGAPKPTAPGKPGAKGKPGGKGKPGQHGRGGKGHEWQSQKQSRAPETGVARYG